MVKRQKEKQHQTAQEHRAHSQWRSNNNNNNGVVQRHLPFRTCALGLNPIVANPVCTPDGVLFSGANLMPFVLKHRVHPITGEPMTTRDIITLQVECINDNDDNNNDNNTKNNDTVAGADWVCPVLQKRLTDHTKVVAIRQPSDRQTAYVYSYEAYHQLNVIPNSYIDLITGESFNKNTDVIIIHDPQNEDFQKRRNINNFYHITHARKLNQDQNNTNANIKLSITASRILDKLNSNSKVISDRTQQQQQLPSANFDSKKRALTGSSSNNGVILARDVTGVQYTSGHGAASLTSTISAVSADNDERPATYQEILQPQLNVMRKLKKKGYVKINTNMGSMTLELHCDIVPRTCYNFLGLCRISQYNDTVFHRLIPGFMVQGGGYNTSGEKVDKSYFENGEAFVDEFDDRLHHTGIGVVSMANAGSNTNKQQFFITFKSCPHLDRKHSVFGQVVDGIDVLKQIEKMPKNTGKHSNEPKNAIVIQTTEILIDPAFEAEELEKQRLDGIISLRQQQNQSSKQPTTSNNIVKKAKTDDSSIIGGGFTVGMYLKDKLKTSESNASKGNMQNITVASSNNQLSSAPKKTQFNFSNW